MDPPVILPWVVPSEIYALPRSSAIDTEQNGGILKKERSRIKTLP
jgi:hypothetical protein